MRSQNLFFFFLVDGQGRSAYWSDDKVKWSSVPKPLQFSPQGWQETELSFDRSNKYFGINRQITTPYKFVEDGASIIRYLFYRQASFESKLYLIIAKWNHLTDLYETYYRGEIDFVKVDDDPATGVQVNIIEGDLLKKLDANEDTDFEIPLDNQQLVQVNGIKLQTQQAYQQLDIDAQELYLNHIVPLFQTADEGTPVNLTFNQTQEYEEQIGTDAAFYVASQNCLVRYSETASGNISFRLQGSFAITLASSDANRGVFILYLIKASDTAFGTRTQLESHVFNAVGESYTYDVDTTVTLAPGQKLFVAGRAYANTPGDSINFTMIYGSETLSISATDRYRTTLTKAIYPGDLLIALLNKMFGTNPYNLASVLLQTTYRRLLCTSGDAIRGIDSPVIKTSFSKFFDAFNKILLCGFGIRGLEVVFEDRQQFYDTSAIDLDLGEISDLKINLAEDQLCNTLRVGYPNRDIESLNGRLAFNSTFQFAFPATKIKKEYDQVSPYQADPYVIESIRLNFGDKATTDSKTDNDTFILNTEEKSGFTGVAITFSEITGALRFTLAGMAAQIAHFAEGDFFQLSPGITEFDQWFQVASASVSGSDLVVTVVTNPNSNGSSFTSDIAFPLQLYRANYDSISGIPDDSDAYNIEDLTPKRMLLKHGPVYRSMYYFMALERLAFTTAERNKELVTVLAGNTIDEDADVRIDKLGAPLFYPYLFSFTTRVPDSFQSIFNTAINGHVQFSYNGFTFYGFPVQMTQQPGTNEAQQWKLLASPLCNLTHLVDLIANPLMNFNMSTYGLSFSKLCPVQFVPQGVTLPDVYNFRHMDSHSFADQKSERYGGYQPYCAKWQTSDIISLQCITRNLGPVQVDVINKYGRVFGSFPLQQVTTTAVQTPYQLFEGDVPLVDFEPGHYQLRCRAGVDSAIVEFLSEVIEIAERWPKTLLFEYTNARNQAATIFSTGYRPSLRVEGNIINFVPESRISSYEDEPANAYILDGTAFRKFTLQVGDSFGLPDYMIDKLNRIMTLTDVQIDGKGFVRNESDQWQPINRVNGLPSGWWTLDVREAKNTDYTSMTTDGQLNQQAVLINVDTALFGDLTNQASSNPVQVEILEP